MGQPQEKTHMNAFKLYIKQPNKKYIAASKNEIIDIAKNLISEDFKNLTKIRDAGDATAFIFFDLVHEEKEIFSCLFLSSDSRVISYERMFEGTINNATVYPREIVKRALALNASRIILAHNHPSGSNNPSQSDKDMTRELKKILTVVDVEVLDHIIIGKDGNFSFVKEKILI